MTTPRDALFVDALSGSDGTAEVAPAPRFDDYFGDPLAALQKDAKATAMPVVSLPVVHFAPPDPREWMSHLAEPEPASQQNPVAAPVRSPAPQFAPAPRAGVSYAPQLGVASYPPGSWPPPNAPGAPARPIGQRHAPRQSSAPARLPLTQGAAAAQRRMQVQRPAPQRPAVAQRPAQDHRSSPQPGMTAPSSRKKTGGAWTTLFVVIIFLVFSGLGRQAIDALLEILNR